MHGHGVLLAGSYELCAVFLHLSGEGGHSVFWNGIYMIFRENLSDFPFQVATVSRSVRTRE